MRYRTALFSAGLLIAALFTLDPAMRAVMRHWDHTAQPIPQYGRVLLLLAGYWSAFWWFLTPGIIGWFLIAAFVTTTIRKSRVQRMATQERSLQSR